MKLSLNSLQLLKKSKSDIEEQRKPIPLTASQNQTQRPISDLMKESDKSVKNENELKI
jgi:hypothetical protein